jgi:hypothetical protein
MPIIDGFDDESIQTIRHLGIVSGAFDSLGIGQVLDRALPKTRDYNMSHTQRVKVIASMDFDSLSGACIFFQHSSVILLSVG